MSNQKARSAPQPKRSQDEKDNGINVGFVSTRLAGTDGVSLEADKWAAVLTEQGHLCHYFAGLLDTPEERSMCLDIAYFGHPDIREITSTCFAGVTRSRGLTRRIQDLKEQLKDALYDYIESFNLEMLIAENALSLPMNLPLGLALSEVIAETGIHTIAHHHDFYWERQRFLVNCVWDYINQAFPPNHPSISHVCINSSARHQLTLRHGISSVVIPNVFDFSQEAAERDHYANDFRERAGLSDQDLLVLQPTRAVLRKGIEHSVEFVKRLDRPATLVISHDTGDERRDYAQRIRDYSDLLGVKTIFASDMIDENRSTDDDGNKIYGLHDIYPLADLVTYPSDFEGFGNAFLETVFHRKPIVVNVYSVYLTDIRPKGFRTIELDGYVTRKALDQARTLLDDTDLRLEMVNHNHDVASRCFSYEVLQRKLGSLMSDEL